MSPGISLSLLQEFLCDVHEEARSKQQSSRFEQKWKVSTDRKKSRALAVCKFFFTEHEVGGQ